MSVLFPLIAGTFIGSYFNNPKIRANTDKAVRDLMGRGVDMLNGLSVGGEHNAPISPIDKASEQ